MTTPSITFEDTTFNVVDHSGKVWLRAADIAQALGYSRSDKISRIYRTHAREFSADMTVLVDIPDPEHLLCVPDQPEPRSGVPGLTRSVRLFSLRGAHLLGMFARTPKAEAFRRWVLDVLEGVTHAPADLHARLLAAEREEARSFATASNAARTLAMRRRAKPILLEAVTRARAEVQMVLALEGGAA
jgi:prophage antirepressor-like protein